MKINTVQYDSHNKHSLAYTFRNGIWIQCSINKIKNKQSIFLYQDLVSKNMYLILPFYVGCWMFPTKKPRTKISCSCFHRAGMRLLSMRASYSTPVLSASLSGPPLSTRSEPPYGSLSNPVTDSQRGITDVWSYSNTTQLLKGELNTLKNQSLS